MTEEGTREMVELTKEECLTICGDGSSKFHKTDDCLPRWSDTVLLRRQKDGGRNEYAVGSIHENQENYYEWHVGCCSAAPLTSWPEWMKLP